MRSGLFWKLFLLQLLAAAAVLAGALSLSRTFSVRGFGEYLETRERERVQQIAAEVADAYAQGGDLMQATENVQALRPRMHRELRRRLPPDAPPREGAPEDRRADQPDDPPPDGVDVRKERIIIRRHVGEPPMPLLQLQDAQGQYLRGDRRPLHQERLREPITVDGKVVGYLAWPAFRVDPHEAAFAHKQAQHLAVIAPVGLLIAALFAAFITALIVRPIRQLSAGAAALARREFATRLPEDRRDELGQLAADFNRLAGALEGYDARQRQWLADIAHELRTPLAILRGEIEAVMEGVRTIGPNLFESLRQEVDRIASLIEDLHLVSLAESGGLRLHVSTEDAGALLQQAVARFGERFRSRGFEVTVASEPGLQVAVDVQRFDQVLGNLLGNIVAHATPPGPVTLGARAEGQHVVVSVADGGPGVRAEALPRLFDRLFRVESARTRATGGAGLGLSICKSIVEAHGGTIEARRSAAGGLEIVIKLPVGAPSGATGRA